MENLELYNAWRAVPKDAQKTITGGNLNGKTDINPMWRIKVLTERFGPVGLGWYTKITEHWTDTETIGGNLERVAWVRVELYVKMGDVWSEPIEGIGGSKYAGKGRGSELNDEAFKMAETDAISVACKKLGIGADIYWAGDSTKYTQGGTAKPKATASKYRALTWDDGDLELRNKLKMAIAQGYDKTACEKACNKVGVTIPSEVWDKLINTTL